MLLRHLPKPNPLLRPPRLRIPHLRTPHQTRQTSTTTPKPPAPPDPPSTRASHLLSRLPPSLQKYTTRLRSAPLSHITAFLILHELTAIVPLVGLFGVFHYTQLAPVGYMLEHYGGYVRQGTERFEGYFRRKGWFGFEKGEEKEKRGDGEGEDEVMRRWEGGEGRYRIVVEVALAYALTKVLLPVRVVGSLWATPWLAGVLGRVRGLVKRG